MVVDQALVSDPNDKKALIEATKDALSVTGTYGESACFNPRHAVSTLDGKTSVVICFECGAAEIRRRKGLTVVPTNDQALPLFDALVRKYHLETKE